MVWLNKWNIVDNQKRIEFGTDISEKEIYGNNYLQYSPFPTTLRERPKTTSFDPKI